MVASLIALSSFALLVIETIVGVVANGFIVLVNSADWFKSRKLSPTDLILTCLSLSRLAWHTIMILDTVMFFYCPGTQSWKYIDLMNYIVWIFTDIVNIWFVTWLSFFYLVKIAIFSHPVFLQVKQRISGLVPWLLLGSVVLAAIMTISIATSLSHDLYMCNFYSACLRVNASNIKTSDPCSYLYTIMIVPNSIPFLLSLPSCILLISSLRKHVRRLQHNGICSMDVNVQGHLTAIKTLASFFVLYLCSFLAIISEAILIWNKMIDEWPIMLLNNVIATYPSGHALILILISPKLKQTWVRMLHYLQFCFSENSS